MGWCIRLCHQGTKPFPEAKSKGKQCKDSTCNPGGGLSGLSRYLPMGVASRSPRVGTFGGTNLGIGNLPVHVGSAALRRLDLEYIGYAKKTLLSWRPVAVILFFFLWWHGNGKSACFAVLNRKWMWLSARSCISSLACRRVSTGGFTTNLVISWDAFYTCLKKQMNGAIRENTWPLLSSLQFSIFSHRDSPIRWQKKARTGVPFGNQSQH